MEVIKNGSVPEEDATNAPLFYGGAVSRQPIVGGGKSSYYNFSQVNFAAGAKNKFHTHTSDQILFVTKGVGIVANESEEIEISEGDTALIHQCKPQFVELGKVPVERCWCNASFPCHFPQAQAAEAPVRAELSKGGVHQGAASAEFLFGSG